MAGTSFYQWLMTQRDRDDEIGDFAQDVASDPGFPSDGNLSQYRRHLQNKHAFSGAFKALTRAYQEWERS